MFITVMSDQPVFYNQRIGHQIVKTLLLFIEKAI